MKGKNGHTWDYYEPRWVAGTVRVIFLSKPGHTQAQTLYYTRTVCCGVFEILNHDQVADRERRGGIACKRCARSLRNNTRAKREPPPLPTAQWPAPEDQVGKRWHGREPWLT